jgi:hypothetical protein
VLETLEYLVHETEVWVEITTLLIPDENDADDEIRAEAEWIRDRLGPGVPLHFTAFHPDHRLRDRARHAAGDAPPRARDHRPSKPAWSTSTPATSWIRSRQRHVVPGLRRAGDRAPRLRDHGLAPEFGRRLPELRHAVSGSAGGRARNLGFGARLPIRIR